MTDPQSLEWTTGVFAGEVMSLTRPPLFVCVCVLYYLYHPCNSPTHLCRPYTNSHVHLYYRVCVCAQPSGSAQTTRATHTSRGS